MKPKPDSLFILSILSILYILSRIDFEDTIRSISA